MFYNIGYFRKKFVGRKRFVIDKDERMKKTWW